MIDKALAHTSFFFLSSGQSSSEILFQLVAVGEMADRLVWLEKRGIVGEDRAR